VGAHLQCVRVLTGFVTVRLGPFSGHSLIPSFDHFLRSVVFFSSFFPSSLQSYRPFIRHLPKSFSLHSSPPSSVPPPYLPPTLFISPSLLSVLLSPSSISPLSPSSYPSI
jgi:hypothetical protein